jgi:hypothetical protein
MSDIIDFRQPETLPVKTPPCVYCSKPMRALGADHLGSEPFTQFKCDQCGWEVALPHE